MNYSNKPPKNWMPPPYNFFNPRPAIVHPTGPNAPDFVEQERCDDVLELVSVGVRTFLKREDGDTDEPLPQGDDEFDDELDEQKSLNELEIKVLESHGVPFFPGLDNYHALRTIRCANKKRNSVQHNNLLRLDVQRQVYLSASLILMGPIMCNCPHICSEIATILSNAGVVPLDIYQLPNRPL